MKKGLNLSCLELNQSKRIEIRYLFSSSLILDSASTANQTRKGSVPIAVSRQNRIILGTYT